MRKRRIWAGALAFTVAGMSGTVLAVGDAQPARAAAGTVVTGSVYADLDRDGTQDSGEPGLKGVTVSDGAVLASTDAQGNYQLTVDTERRGTDLVFVSAPSGFVPPVDEQNIPRFYAKLSPDAAGEARVDFGLRPDPAALQPDFRFVGLADVHVQAGTTNNKERFSAQIAQVNELIANSDKERPRFTVISGDLTNNATPAEFADFRAAAAVSTLPVWPAIGNHEYNAQSGNTYGALLENYRQAVGPEWYSFTYGNKHFVILDNIRGLREEEQYRWLEQDLALNGRNREIVVITHIPMNTPQATDAARIPQYVALLEQYDTKLLLAGHTHSNDVDDQVIDGALHAVTTSSSYTIDQTPNGFRVVDFHGDRVRIPFREYGAARSLTLVHPAPDGNLPRTQTDIVVNAYYTSAEVAKAKFRIDGGDWLSLSPSGDWTWAADFDARGLELGRHTLQVEVTESGGASRSESATFTVVAPNKIAAPELGTPWATFHGDNAHSGRAAESLEAPLQLAWNHRTGGKILTGSPALSGDSAYIGVRDDNGVAHNSVLAVDIATGRQRWRVHTDAQIEGSPAVAGDLVYATSVRGTVYALDSATGAIRWQHRVGNPGDRTWSYQAPTVEDATVYQAYSTQGGAALVALDAASGAVRWRTTGLGSNWHSFGTAAVGGGLVFSTAQGGRISALDAATGAVKWSRAPAGG